MLTRIGMPVSDDTILRHLKRQTKTNAASTSIRAAGIDDWAWRKGFTYGTTIVDLERREVLTFCRSVRLARLRTGSSGILKSRSSAAIAAVHLPRARMKAHRKRFKSPTDSIFYCNNWRMAIVIEALQLALPGVVYPRHIEGARRGPPEDVGRPWSYSDLEALADPSHDQHAELTEWSGGNFDR